MALVGAVLASPIAVRAQQHTGKVRRIAYLSPSTATAAPGLPDAFQQGLRDLGWVDGQNIEIEYRFSNGESDRLPGLAKELVGLRVELIAAVTTLPALAAKNATDTIPIVGISFDNPVQHGLVASLARPGGNVTGLAYSAGPEIFGKDLGLLRELIPEVRLVAVLSNSMGPNHAPMASNVKIAALSLGLELLILDARRPDEFDRAFEEMTNARVGALFVFGDPMFSIHRARLAGLAVKHRLPAMYTNRPHVEAGGLMCYGPSFPDLWRRAAGYVDKILKGARPADLPVEEPTKYELVINLKTAQQLGLTVPPSLLSRADEVIE
jgi:putative ABC transport system substrate-binding protein